MTVEIKNRYTGDVVKVVDAETLQNADLWGADLRGANLRGSDLRGAILRGADLWGASLRGANLRGANLRGADLWGANLRGVILRGADLRGANLRGSDLRGAILRGADLKIFQAGRYIAYVTSTHTCIGCQAHDNSTWREFSDGVIGDMASDALEWWKANSAIVFAIMDNLAAEFPVKEEAAA